jgi:CheY-like chemotaxis protein
VNREILIVEDNPADVRLMREALKEIRPPINIHVAQDGEEALQFLRREGHYTSAPMPAMVFLDFNLPRANSRDVLREIKRDISLRPIAVIVLTTSDVASDVLDAYHLHANCYVRKPSDLDAFLSTIQIAAHFWLNVAAIPGGLDGEAVH